MIGNRAHQNGGGPFCQSPEAPAVTNNTFDSNSAAAGGAICCSPGCSPTVKNTLFSGSQADQGDCVWRDATGSPAFSYCCFWDNGDQPFYPTNWNPIGSGNNFEGDPAFLAPWVGEYHLRSGSPCINAGRRLRGAAGMDGSGRQAAETRRSRGHWMLRMG